VKRRIAAILTYVFLGVSIAGAQETFNVIYENPFLINGGGRGEAIAYHQGEFHLLGRIVGSDALTHGIFLKYSSEGEVLLSELFSSPLQGYKTDVAHLGEIARVEDGIVSPMTEWLNYQQGNLNGDSLIKLNYSGEVLWKKSLAVDSTGYEVEIYRGCSDYLGEGYIVHGYIVDSIGVVTSYDQIKGLLTRTDLEGNILWHQRYPQVKEIWYSAALPDGGILLSGQQNLSNGNGSDIIILRTDEQGNELWRHVFWEQEQGTGVSETTAPFCFLQDGTIAVITHNLGLEGYDSDRGPWWVKRIQDNGDSYTILEDFLFDTNDVYHYAFQVSTLSNGNVVLVGQSNNSDPGPFDFNHLQATLVMLSPELDSLYTRYYNFFPGDSASNADPYSQIHDIVELPDGGFAMAGMQRRSPLDTFVPMLTHIWTLRVDSMGCLEPGCHLISGLQEQVIGLDGSMTVFPNPLPRGQALQLRFQAKGTATMPYNNEATRLLLFDLQGRLVHEEQLTPTGSNEGFMLSLDLPALAKGTYTLHWISEHGAWYDGEKVVVE